MVNAMELDIDLAIGAGDDVIFKHNGPPRPTRCSRILAVERPQMPQIVHGYATNYPHFLTRDYFAQSSAAYAFLSPPEDFHIDGVGYLDYFTQQFEVISRAGAGNFSSVFSARSLEDGQLYAVKKTRRPYAGRQERARRLHEVELLWDVMQGGSPSIVRLVNAWEQFGHLYMQFELCEQGNLAVYLEQLAHNEPGLDRVPEPRAWAILAHAAHALLQLHARGIAHLDVKPANFLLGGEGARGFDQPGAELHEGWLKLADFGHAARVARDAGVWVEEGDREYMAPEALHGKYTKAADVFSLGLLMLEMLANIVLPENGVEWHKLRSGCFDDECFVDLPYSAELLDTVKHMLNPNPDSRPTVQHIVSLDKCRRFASPPQVQRHANGARPHALARAATAASAPAHHAPHSAGSAASVHPMTTRSAAKRSSSAPSARGRRRGGRGSSGSSNGSVTAAAS